MTIRPGRSGDEVIDPEAGDLVDLPQGFHHFLRSGVFDPGMKGGEDALLGGEPCADNEGEFEAFTVARVEVVEFLVFGFGKAVESEAALLAGGFGGERAGPGHLACEVRVGAEEREFLLLGGGVDDGAHFGNEIRPVLERAHGGRTPRHPLRVFINAAEQFDKVCSREWIQLGNGRH